MKKSNIKVRFAPSPTGYLHIGGARTALFNWIFAKHNSGTFLLRIEDTDRSRSNQKFLDSILASLKWLGIDWDEEIYTQSNNVAEHISAAEELMNGGFAYKCFCSAEDIEARKNVSQDKRSTYKYDGFCRDLSKSETDGKMKEEKPYVIRFRVPEGKTEFVDAVHGRTVFQNSEIDDFVLLRADKTPTYQLAVVVDDHLMEISHVIRGDDHLSNTPKQILLYRSFGWELPVFAHMPMILGKDKSRLSKRHGAVSSDAFREKGYLSEAIRNYLVLLGWSPGDDVEILPIEDVVRLFQLEDTLKKSAVFDEDKLKWMNDKYISALSETLLISELQLFLEQDDDLYKSVKEKGDEYLIGVLKLIRPRMKLLTDFIPFAGYFYRDPVVYDPEAVKKYWMDEKVAERLGRVRLSILDCQDFTIENIEKIIRTLAEELGISAAKLIHPVRVALTGFSVSPGLFEVIYCIGKDSTVRRLENAVNYLQTL
ncbi:glutamate--tRNA ligase [candidate division KSB1 bacterium]